MAGLTRPETVECIACGDTVRRSNAREYDRYGDRWDREDRRFEYLCKPCDRERCHQSRDGLEATLIQAGAGEVDRAEFLRSFLHLDRRESGTEPEE